MPAPRLPASSGYRMPAEWEPHRATWIAWPHNRSDWPGKFAPIPWIYVEIVRHLHRSERVRIITLDPGRPKRMLARAGVDLRQVDFFRLPTDRSWTRDYGPMFVKSRRGLAISDWHFNAWAKYRNWKNDSRIAASVAKKLRIPLLKPVIRGGDGEVPELEGQKTGARRDRRTPAVLEGGSIDVNGRGTLLTTEECLLSAVQQRNWGATRQGLEEVLGDSFGVKHFLWLNRGIAGDDTHGHIDDVARFVGPATVAAAVEEDPKDPNYEPLQENLHRLREMTDQDGKRLRVVELPMPGPVYFDGRRLPASYANFYIANKIVLMPTFHDRRDREALAILARLFPDREVIGIHSVDLAWGLGTLHCLTQQEPA